ESAHIRQAEVEDDAVEAAVAQDRERFLAALRRGDVDVALAADQLHHRLELILAVFDDQQAAVGLVEEAGDLRERAVQRFLRDRLLQMRKRAEAQTALAFFI